MKKLLILLLLFSFCNGNNETSDIEYKGSTKIFPDSCEIEVKDLENNNKYATNNYDCSTFFDENQGFYIFPNNDELDRCNNLQISYKFDNEVNIDYVSLENIKSERAFKTRHSFRILETYVDPDYYRMVSLYPDRTNQVQYFDVFEKSDIYIVDIIQIYKSESYSILGLELFEPKNECSLKEFSFYGKS